MRRGAARDETHAGSSPLGEPACVFVCPFDVSWCATKRAISGWSGSDEKRAALHHSGTAEKGVNCGTDRENLRLHPGEHPGAERGPPVDRPAGGGRAGEQHPAGQAVRQGLPSPPVQAVGAEIEKRRSALRSRASTVWGATMGRSWSSGGCSPRRRGWTSWCWTCPCWIPAGGCLFSLGVTAGVTVPFFGKESSFRFAPDVLENWQEFWEL